MTTTARWSALLLLGFVVGCGAAPLDGDTGEVTGAVSPEATVSDGPPMRRQCTNTFGNALSATHGRLDGFLVSIVAPGTRTCSGDSGHIHLQVLMHNSVYNIAVNVQDNQGPAVDFLAKNIAMPDGAWSEGWHTSDGLSYPSTLGVHSGDFTPMSESALTTTVENELAQANHISIFATGFNSTGAHLVHFQGGSNDGAIVINPLSSPARMLLFHFASQSF